MSPCPRPPRYLGGYVSLPRSASLPWRLNPLAQVRLVTLAATSPCPRPPRYLGGYVSLPASASLPRRLHPLARVRLVTSAATSPCPRPPRHLGGYVWRFSLAAALHLPSGYH